MASTTTTTTTTTTSTGSTAPTSDVKEGRWANLLPKNETNALEFLKQNPDANGKNVVVAVFDTGVDPGASGLQVTPSGEPKILDIIDCTGDGDVKCSVVKNIALEPGASIQGLTGRILQLNQDWVNPSGLWRLGIKRGYELFPDGLCRRLKIESKKKWDEKHAAAIAVITEELSKWKQEHSNSAAVPSDAIKVKQDLDARFDYLKNFKYDDPGPIYDIIVWNDGDVWRGAIDCSEVGDLTEEKGLTDYKLEHQFGSFGPTLQLNYVLSIHENGNVCNICCDSGSHGTHVAGIIGAYRPDDPAHNGVAPGCQIISCKIGDMRVGTMETTKALTRALAEAVKHKVDLINMSFGETTSAANTGYFVKMADEVVNKHGCIFLSSAGNAGPALSTAGAPGASSDSIIGIGAYVSAEMMKTCYSMPYNKVQGYETKYTWSSVGPALDGGIGAHITAPGGAVTCVPNWTLAKSQLMNGTSMSSPNACGNVALLLSACQAEGIKVSKHRILRALCNTARKLDDCTLRAQGCGLVQVDKAWEYLKINQNAPFEDVEFRVSTSPPAGRGIYLRDAHQLDKESTHIVTIKPCFHEEIPKADMISFEAKIQLESDQQWISVPQDFVLASKAREFKVVINPEKLTGVNYGHVLGYDASDRSRGPLFRVPVTLTVPMRAANEVHLDTLIVKRGEIRRFFFTPPIGSSWMDITIKRATTCSGTSNAITVLHTMQLVKNKSYGNCETKNYVRLEPGEYDVISRKIDGQGTVEVCVALYWSEFASVTLDVSAAFNGVVPSPSIATIAPGSAFSRVELLSPIANIPLDISAKLEQWCRSVRPTSALLYPLDSRENHLDGKIVHELLLEYQVKIDEASKIVVKFPSLQNRVYEAEVIGGPMVMVFDSKKKILGCADLYTSKIQVPKGDIVIRAFIRHPSATLLQSFENLSAIVERPLPKQIVLKTFSSVSDLVAHRQELKKKVLCRGSMATVFLAEPEYDQLPKDTAPGDFFAGTVNYEKEKESKLGKGGRPVGYAVQYFSSIAPKATVDPKPLAVPTNQTESEKLASAVKDLTISTLSSLIGKSEFDEILNKAEKDFADDLEVAQCKLRHLDAVAQASSSSEGDETSDSSDGSAVEALENVVKQADKVASMIDQQKLAEFFGTKCDPDDPQQVSDLESKNKSKKVLVDALETKASAIGKLLDLKDENTEDKFEPFNVAIKELQKWETLSDEKHLSLLLQQFISKKQYGSALKVVDKALKKNDGKVDSENIVRRQQLTASLDFGHITTYHKLWDLIDAPREYPLP